MDIASPNQKCGEGGIECKTSSPKGRCTLRTAELLQCNHDPKSLKLLSGVLVFELPAREVNG